MKAEVNKFQAPSIKFQRVLKDEELKEEGNKFQIPNSKFQITNSSEELKDEVVSW